MDAQGVDGVYGGVGTGVRNEPSVILIRKFSSCLRVKELCSVSRGRILGTFQPSVSKEIYTKMYNSEFYCYDISITTFTYAML